MLNRTVRLHNVSHSICVVNRHMETVLDVHSVVTSEVEPVWGLHPIGSNLGHHVFCYARLWVSTLMSKGPRMLWTRCVKRQSVLEVSWLIHDPTTRRTLGPNTSASLNALWYEHYLGRCIRSCFTLECQGSQSQHTISRRRSLLRHTLP